MSNKLKAAKAAFPLTIPVLCGYFFTGMAFGLLMYNGVVISNFILSYFC